MSTESIQAHKASVERHLRALLNNNLKDICRSENLSVSGVKSVLQGRILTLLNDAVTSGDTDRFYDIANKIKPNTTATSIGSPNSGGVPPKSSSYQASTNGSYTGMAGGQRPQNYTTPNFPRNRPLTFVANPFFKVLEPWSPVIGLQTLHSARSSSQITVKLTQTQVDRLKANPALRIMMFCASDPLAPEDQNIIAFPHQMELRVNGELFDGNTRGLKKRPGTTKPADITKFFRRQPNYANEISIVYAAIEKRFFYQVNVVHKHSVEELVTRIRSGQIISAQSVVKEMVSKAQDPDIVYGPTVMSLKCPFSTMRMDLPCRSTVCNHNQCFDATSFLQTQEQAPQWQCPVCNKSTPFRSLAIDEYVLGILNSTSRDTDQVTIEADGTWKQGSHKDEFKSPSSATRKRAPPPPTPMNDDDDDDDVIEISDHRINGMKAPENIATPPSSTKTTWHSREPSAAASNATGHTTGSKRPASEVIDLTLSDSDDDQPPTRPIKRQSTSFHGVNPYAAQQHQRVSFPLPRQQQQQHHHHQMQQMGMSNSNNANEWFHNWPEHN